MQNYGVRKSIASYAMVMPRTQSRFTSFIAVATRLPDGYVLLFEKSRNCCKNRIFPSTYVLENLIEVWYQQTLPKIHIPQGPVRTKQDRVDHIRQMFRTGSGYI